MNNNTLFALFFILFFLFSTLPVLGEEDNQDNLTKEETLERLIESDLIKDKYKECKESKAAEPWECVWGKLKPEEQEQVADILGKFNDDETNKAADKNGAGNKYEGKALNIFGEKADPVMQQLGDNLFKMFQEAMYGEYTEQVRQQELRLVDHAVFYDIYKARISKEFIELVASFCLDSSKSGLVYTVSDDEEELKKIREQNIKNLHDFPEDEKNKFNICITQIKNICTHVSSSRNNCGKKIADKEIACASDSNTQNRACEVQEAVNAIKKNIAATEVIQKEIKDEAQKEQGQGSLGDAITGRKVSIYNGAKMDDRQSVDTMTTISSGQLAEAIKDGEDSTIFDKAAEELNEECKDSLTKKCKEYVLEGDKIEEQKDKISEVALRVKAMNLRVQKNLEKAKTGDKDAKDELAQFLREEGIKEEDIEGILSDDKKIKIITDQIIENYEARKDAIISNLNNQLTKMIPKEDTDEEKLNVVKTISKELMDRPKHYQQLLHYSNIVSSYLSTSGGNESGNEDGGKDEQALQVDGDKDNRYKTAAAKELGSLSETFADAGEELIKKIGIEPEEDSAKDEEGLISIGLDTINSFLYQEVLEKDSSNSKKKE